METTKKKGSHMQKVIKYYEDNLKKYGPNDERSLGWTKHKQEARFTQLLRFLKPERGTLLDIGCGFGDLYTYLKKNPKYRYVDYTGIDVMQQFIDIAIQNHPDKCDSFYRADFCTENGRDDYDFCVASGIFGHMVYESEQEMYGFVEKIMSKAFQMCRGGVAFNFLSDKVDYRTSAEDFHASPEKVLSLAYRLSKNIVLDNSTMPFEFSVTIFKDDSFDKETTMFMKSGQEHGFHSR